MRDAGCRHVRAHTQTRRFVEQAAHHLRTNHRRARFSQAEIINRPEGTQFAKPGCMLHSTLNLLVPVFALPLVVACSAKLSAGPMQPAAGVEKAPRPTQPFLDEHAELHEHLRHVSDMVGRLRLEEERDRKETMAHVVRFFRTHLVPHAEWEERVLYPLVDEKAGGGPNRFTASMRHEHRIVGRWIGELEQQAEAPSPDSIAFARRADQLLGLVQAHFEAEEQVLLPILDATMTREEFEQRVGSGKH